MRSKTIWLVIIVSAIVAIGLYLPNFTYAGQMGSSGMIFGPLADNVGSTVPIMSVRDHGHGSWHGAARAFHGGRGFYGRGFYGGTYSYPYYGERFYTEPSCDSVVWDSDLDEWVCADDYATY